MPRMAASGYVCRGSIKRLVSAVAKVRACRAEERLSVGDAFRHGGVGVRLRRVSIRLGVIEHAVSPSEEQTRAARHVVTSE
jgi:hypothetical protein